MVFAADSSSELYLRIWPTSSSSDGEYVVSVLAFDPLDAVTFTAPTSNSTWTTGAPYPIEWQADTALLGTTVRLQLCRDTVVLYTIESVTTNDGTSTYNVPDGLASSDRYRIKILNYSTQELYAYSDTFTISGLMQDEYEPDDTLTQAHALTVDAAPEQHTLPRNDVDWYSVEAERLTLYVFETFDSLNTIMRLYAANGSTLLDDDNNSGTLNNARISWLCQSDGTYYLEVSGASYGSYRISATSYDSTVYRFAVSSPLAIDTFAVGDTCTIEWSAGVDVGGQVDVFLYDGSQVLSTIVAGTANDGSHEWVVPLSVSTRSTYRIKVASRDLSDVFGYSAQFTVTNP